MTIWSTPGWLLRQSLQLTHLSCQLSPLTFRWKLYLRLSRTYLQEPALRRPGGIQSCPTVTGLYSPRPLSSLLRLFWCRPSAPSRNPLLPRQVPASQQLPHRRTAGCTCVSLARTPRVRPSASMSPSNWPKRFSRLLTRSASMTGRSESTTAM